MLTPERLRELLHYDQASGVFTRRLSRGGVRAGTVAGSLDIEGYRVIRVDEKLYKAHRLAVLYMVGRWPPHQVDHINREHDDNRWANLREATNSENHQNIRAARKHSCAKVLGVSWHRNIGKWQSQIQVNKKKIPLGYFDSQSDAHSAYLSAKRKLHPFAVGAL